MQGNQKSKYGNFPDPFASPDVKASREYGLQYAKAVEGQWGKGDDQSSMFRKRLRQFERNRDYANGTQDTSVYKQILNSLDPNNGDGTLLNLDWSPVPIIPKFVKVVVNRVLSRKPYPNVEAIDPVSMVERQEAKAEIEVAIEERDSLMQAQSLGLNLNIDPASLPESTEEAEIYMDVNLKTSL